MSLFLQIGENWPKVESKQTETPRHGQTATGYGSKIPTSHLVKWANRWRRVYVTCYSNSGTAWITVKGERVIVGGSI